MNTGVVGCDVPPRAPPVAIRKYCDFRKFRQQSGNYGDFGDSGDNPEIRGFRQYPEIPGVQRSIHNTTTYAVPLAPP